MIYLNSAQFKPLAILLSIVFFPIIFGGAILCFSSFNFLHLIVAVALVFVYFISIFGGYKYSKTKMYYLIFNDNKFEINYPNVGTKGYLSVDVKDVVKLDYYKINSLRSWLMLHSYVLPCCVYITYNDENKEICKLIGYMNYNQIKDLSVLYNITLEVH